jgi:hypothetical protein
LQRGDCHGEEAVDEADAGVVTDVTQTAEGTGPAPYTKAKPAVAPNSRRITCAASRRANDIGPRRVDRLERDDAIIDGDHHRCTRSRGGRAGEEEDQQTPQQECATAASTGGLH